MLYHTLLCLMGEEEQAKIIQIIGARSEVNNREALKLAAAMLKQLDEKIESHLKNSRSLGKDDNAPVD